MVNVRAKAEEGQIGNYYDVMRRHLGGRGVERLRHQMDFQYQDIRFDDLRIIDIGGGNGIHALYAAVKGAKEVLVIEPEDAGSTAGVVEQFNTWKNELGNSNVELLTTSFQDYNHAGDPFDIIIIQDAINHLDEDACVKLSSDVKSRQKFEIIFSKLASISHSGTILHFSDCSSSNFYPSVGLANPFDPGIEWEKHQPPNVWIGMLKEVGFELMRKRWSTPSRLGSLGVLLSGGAFPAYFFTSHFVVTMKMS
jgi:hypothetical protein